MNRLRPVCSQLRRPPPSLRQQRGAALFVALLLGILISLTMLIVSLGSSTELKIARNDLKGRQAMGLAEAGLNHALAVIPPSAADGSMNEELGNAPTGGLGALGAAFTINENGTNFVYRCAAFGGATGGHYCVRAYDNFDETGNELPTAATADNAANDADTTIYVRARAATGAADPTTITADSSVRIIDALVGVTTGPECAILTQGNLQVTGNPTITGSRGCVHSNSNLVISGNPNLSQGAYSSGTMTVSGSPTMEGIPIDNSPAGEKTQYQNDHQSQPPKPIPSVRPFAFGPSALNLCAVVSEHPRGYRLDADANIYVSRAFNHLGVVGTTAWTCTGEATANVTGGYLLTAADKVTLGLRVGGSDIWTHSGTNWGGNANQDEWTSNGATWADGVYFVEGSLVVNNNWGLTAAPWRASLIATNSIQTPATPIIAPFSQTSNSTGPGFVVQSSPPTSEWNLRNVSMVAGNDIEINGNAGSFSFAGGFFAHQQIKINGNPDIAGFLIAEDGLTTWTGDPAPNCNSDRNLLCDPAGNSVSGNPTINFNGLGTALYPDRVTRLSWSDAR